MLSEEIFYYSTILVSLFLKSSMFPGELHVRDSDGVLRVLRTARLGVRELCKEFAQQGLWEASMRLSIPGLLPWAEELVLRSKALTSAHPEYPSRLRTALGALAPVAFYCLGLPGPGAPVSLLGSKAAPEDSVRFARLFGAAVGKSQCKLVTRGTDGIELIAETEIVANGGSALRFLPFGIEQAAEIPGVCQLSPYSPNAGLSYVNSLDAGLLCVACSERSFVLHTQFKFGGTWRVVQEGLRRKLTSFLIPAGNAEPWSDALAYLGASRIASLDDLFT